MIGCITIGAADIERAKSSRSYAGSRRKATSPNRVN
jgi:hypothetical protein